MATVSATLIALVIFIIIDLDQPRRVLTRVDQDSMLDLAVTLPENGVSS